MTPIITLNKNSFLYKKIEIANASKRLRWNFRRRHTFLTK